MAGDASLIDPTPTLSRVMGQFQVHRTPQKNLAERQADERRIKLWSAFLGAQKDLSKLTLHEWGQFIEARRLGIINAQGALVPDDQREPVRDGTVAADLVFLKSVLNWATKWQDEQARYLMRENPARGFPIPSEKNPRRPLATRDRFEKVLAVASQVMMLVGRGKKARRLPSYLAPILVIAHGTGRRISAILALRGEDLKLDLGLHGSIRWPAATDKTGREWTVPLSQEVRAAIDRVEDRINPVNRRLEKPDMQSL